MDDALLDMHMAAEPIGTGAIRAGILLRQTLLIDALMEAGRKLTLAAQLCDLQMDHERATIFALRARTLLADADALVSGSGAHQDGTDMGGA